MKGFYLYGICPFLSKRKRLDIKGIDSAGKINFLRYRDIGAIFSEVKLEEFDSEEIQRRATEDLEWIKNKAVIHEKVIEAAMKGLDISIIPMKFGTIFKTKDGLLTSLKESYPAFKKLLEKLEEKEEWALKAYSDTAVLVKEVKNNSSSIQEKLKEASFLPAGKDYFLEKEIEEMAVTETQETLNNYYPIFLKFFQQIAEEAKENKILGKELTQKSEPMIFNSAFLIKKSRSKEFLKQAQKLENQFKDKGLIFEVSGPWPPYNFV